MSDISFKTYLKNQNKTLFPLKSTSIDIFQMNVGKLCNMTCSHCHVEAGPDRTELMDKSIFERCLFLIKQSNVSTIDLTGGAPEMNPHLTWFIQEVSKLNKRVIVRSNLTVLLIPKYSHFIDLFTQHNVEIVASLPCYLEDNTNQQRGDKAFQRSINVLQKLNQRGYGKQDSGLILNLVHNPVGASLPPNQKELEIAYKKQLLDLYGIHFNTLFCITNMPIKRYEDFLKSNNDYERYMELLRNAYNPAAVESVMCRNTLSIGYDGVLYDCDFNQMLNLPLSKIYPQHVNDLSLSDIAQRNIVVKDHCFGCTAGAGSSCQGSLD